MTLGFSDRKKRYRKLGKYFDRINDLKFGASFFDDVFYNNEKLTDTRSFTEGRAASAYVLNGDGRYVLRNAGEVAYAKGHGLDVFGQYENFLAGSETLQARPGVGL